MLYWLILLFIYGCLKEVGGIDRPPVIPSILTVSLFLPILAIAYGVAHLTIPSTSDQFLIAKEISWMVACMLSGIISWAILAEDEDYDVTVPLIVFLNHILLPLPLAIVPKAFVESLVRWVPRSILATFVSCLPLMSARTLATIVTEVAIISTLVYLSNYVNILNSWIAMVFTFAVIGMIFSIIDSASRHEPSYETVFTVLRGALLGFIVISFYKSLTAGLPLDVANLNAGLSIILNLPYVLTACFTSALGSRMYFELVPVSRHSKRPTPSITPRGQVETLENGKIYYKPAPQWVDKMSCTMDSENVYMHMPDKCREFTIKPNFSIVEVNERIHYIRVRRLNDSTLFEFRDPIRFYLLSSIKDETDLCRILQLYKGIIETLAIVPLKDDDIKALYMDREHRMLSIEDGLLCVEPKSKR